MTGRSRTEGENRLVYQYCSGCGALLGKAPVYSMWTIFCPEPVCGVSHVDDITEQRMMVMSLFEDGNFTQAELGRMLGDRDRAYARMILVNMGCLPPPPDK